MLSLIWIVCSTVYVLHKHIFLGSMFGTNVLDKDGVSVAVVTVERRYIGTAKAEIDNQEPGGVVQPSCE